MNKCTERIYNGLIKENPTFVLMLGMCPTLAVTTSATNGIGMGLSTTAVLIMSNMLISMLRKIIPDSVRMPAFIVVVASFVTIVDFLLEGFLPGLYDSLGLYIPLIVVNCIILGRAESYASKNPVLPSIFDGVGMGLGFTFGLTCIGIVRELIGAGQIFGVFRKTCLVQPDQGFFLTAGKQRYRGRHNFRSFDSVLKEIVGLCAFAFQLIQNCQSIFGIVVDGK